MQKAENFPEDLTVAEGAAVVRVNGEQVPVESVTVTRELSSTLPSQVDAGSDMMSATGSVTWSTGDDVTSKPAHPWNRGVFPPRPSDDVTVDMGYRGALTRQMTGKIDHSSGSVASGDVSSQLVDETDKLERLVSFPPHLEVMPPWEEGGPFLYAKNTPTFTTDRVLRACGFYATPPAEPSAVLSVPLMGSAWPEIGKLISARAANNPSDPPSFSGTQWGIGANSIIAEYQPILNPLSNTNNIDKTFQITMKVRNVTPGGDVTDVSAWWGGTRIRLRVGPRREIQAILNDGTGTTFVAGLTAGQAFSADVFTLSVNTGGSFTINANNGANVVGTKPLPDIMKTTDITRITIGGAHFTSAHIGGVQVNFYNRPTYLAKTTAVLTPSAVNRGLDVMRRIDARSGLDVLKEQAEAECAAMWIDEQGVFRWVDRETLAESEPVATLTALNDIYDIGWDSSAKGVRSGVVVESDQWDINRSDYSNQELWDGTAASLEPRQKHVEFAEPETDVEWFGVDESVRLAGSWAGPADYFNRGIGTYSGGIVEDDGTEEWAQNGSSGFTSTLERVGLFTYKFLTSAGIYPSSKNLKMSTVSKETDSKVRSSFRGINLPILRGKVRAEATPRRTRGITKGPANAAELVHDVRSWVQHPDSLRNLANWLAAWVTTPRPVVSDVDVVPDTRRQLGDIVWLDGGRADLYLKVLITKISTTVEGAKITQSIGGRVLVSSSTATNKDLDRHAGTYSNLAFDQLWSERTNKQLDAAPLGRG